MIKADKFIAFALCITFAQCEAGASAQTQTQTQTQTVLGRSSPSVDFARQDVLDPRAFGAAGDGKADDTVAFQKAIDAGRTSGRPIGGIGIFRIDGMLDPAGATIVGAALSYTRNSTDPRTWGLVIEHNNADGPLFRPTACGMLFRNVVLYDPRQSGSGIVPKVRPPMFRITQGQCTDFTFENSVVVNAYDLFRFDRGTVSGDWRVRGNRIYAIRYGFDVVGSIPEVLFLSDNIWSPGVWQQEAVHANGAMLAKWTGANGAIFRIDSNAATTDGLKSSNEFIFAYKNYVKIESGGLNVSSITGTSFDQVPQPLSVANNGIVILTITGGFTYAKSFGQESRSVSAFAIAGSGARRVTVVGHSVLYATGGVLEVLGSGRGAIDWQGGQVVSFGQGAPAAVALYADAPATDLTWSPALTECGKSDQRGAIIADVRILRISSAFSGCTLAVDIKATPAMVAGIDGSIIVKTVGVTSYRNAAGGRFKATGVYDKP